MNNLSIPNTNNVDYYYCYYHRFLRGIKIRRIDTAIVLSSDEFSYCFYLATKLFLFEGQVKRHIFSSFLLTKALKEKHFQNK